jgi:hypothetical protein
MPDVTNEIETMLGSFEGKIEEPKTEEPKTEDEVKEPTDDKEKKETEVVEDGVKSDDKLADDKEALDEKDKVILDLRTKLEEAEKKKEEVKKEEPKETSLTFEPQDFIGDQDPEDIVRDKDSFNKLLNNIYTKGITDARKLISEHVLLSIPDIVKANVEIVTTLRETSEKFYADNEDLKPFKRVVAAVFEDLASKNPDKKYTEIMDEVGNEARKRLNLQKAATKKKDDPPPPKLPSKSGGAREKSEKPDLSPMENEISLMTDTLTRR